MDRTNATAKQACKSLTGISPKAHRMHRIFRLGPIYLLDAYHLSPISCGVFAIKLILHGENRCCRNTEMELKIAAATAAAIF